MTIEAAVDWIVAIAAAGAVAGLAGWLGALTMSGVAAALPIGAVVLALGGLGAAVILVLFFVSSSALSRLPDGAEARRVRDARQVLANGSVAAVAAALMGWSPVAAQAFLGAVAAAAADTWATEIGVRFGGEPRSILSLRRRSPGTSGAVSPLGLLAGAAGALAVGLTGWWLLTIDGRGIVLVTGAGFAGSVVDSVLGDGAQASYRCSTCGERPQVARHRDCPTVAERISGVPGLDNDVVNWLATLSGAGLAAACAIASGW